LLTSLALILLNGCDDIARDNILDPKNPASESQKIVTVEAFVYTGSDAPNSLNDTLLYALDRIKNTYENKINVLEYHRYTKNYFADPYVIDPFSGFSNENQYNIYTGNMNEGVPDVFINGIAARVQGASTIENSVFRIDQALQPYLIQNSYFSIEPDISTQDDKINLSAAIARLGSEDAKNILVKAIIIYHVDNNILKRVVHGIGKSKIIEEIDHGEIKEVDFSPIPKADFNYISVSVVFMVTSEDETKIYQSIEVQIP